MYIKCLENKQGILDGFPLRICGKNSPIMPNWVRFISVFAGKATFSPMKYFLFPFENAVRYGLVLLGISAAGALAQTKTYVVDGPGKLSTIAAQIQAAPAGGTHIVQFKTYVNVGAFSLTGLTADSLIFQRAEESAEVVEFSGTLFQMQSVSAAVVFRNLAFKAKDGSAKFIQGATVGNENRNLLIDSCQIFGDTLNTTFLAWNGATAVGSKILIQRSVINGSQGSSPKIDLTVDTVRVLNCYLNFSGQVVGSISKRIDITNLSTNRVQFRLTGDGTTLYNFKNNLYGNPPSVTKLPGLSNKFIMYLIGFAGGTAYGDVRFSTWYNFEYPANEGHADPSNLVIAPFGDTLARWDFKQASEKIIGYQNPVSAAYPDFNVFPGETSLKTRLSAQDSVELVISSAQIPRVITAAYATVAYPGLMDSTRSLWAKDTVLKVAGPVSVSSITFPQIKAPGTPILYSESGATYAPGTAGAEGAVVFSNALPAAKKFIPAFGNQNTPKGLNVSVKGLGADTTLNFTTVTRSGRTGFQVPVLGAGKKRWRVLQKGAKPFGFLDTTAAEGAGELKFGFGKTGVDLPFRSDSLSWLLNGGTLSSVTDSAGKYWGKTTAALSNQAILIERLSVGAGRDTVRTTVGDIFTLSAKGHQLSVDSSFMPTVRKFPDLGLFSKGLAFKWPGRAPNDSLIIILRRSSLGQKLFWVDSSNTVQPITVMLTTPESLSVRLTLPPIDSNKVFFFAHHYMVPAGLKSTVMLGQDTLKDIISLTPGDLALDTLPSLQGLGTDSLRILLKRRITQVDLSITGPYAAVLQGLPPNRLANIRMYMHRGARWDSISGTYQNGYYRVPVQPTDSVIVVGEVLEKLDTLPVIASLSQTVSVIGTMWSFKPTLTVLEKTRLIWYHLQIFNLDATGHSQLVQVSNMAGDSTYSGNLATGNLQAIKIGYESFSGKITWSTPMILSPTVASFTEAMNAQAPTLHKYVYELVGFPSPVDIEKDIKSKIMGPKKNVSISDWQGRWVDLVGSTIKPTRGYLMGIEEDFKPSAPLSYTWKLSADTVALDTGWQLVSSPLPIPYAEKSIGFDPTAISYFYSLSWAGSGPTAIPNWIKVDSLRPFKGYAVYAVRKTNLVFDPWKAFSPTPTMQKSTASKALTFKFVGPMSGEMEIAINQGSLLRPSPFLPFWDSPRSLAWDSPFGNISKGIKSVDDLNEVVVLRLPQAEVFKIETQNEGAAHYALWDARSETLTAIDGAQSFSMASGQNWLRVMAISPEGISAMEAALKKSSNREIGFLPFVSAGKGKVELGFISPMNLGQMDEVNILGVGIDGKIRFEKRLKHVNPGAHSVPIDISLPGALFISVEFKNGLIHKKFLTKYLSLGGGL